MKQPKLSDLELDVQGTTQIRAKMAKNRKIKITINLDEDLLTLVKEHANKTGAPYQNLINRLIRGALIENREESTRLDRLEKDLAALKKEIKKLA